MLIRGRRLLMRIIPFKSDTKLDYCTERRIRETSSFLDEIGEVTDIGEFGVVTHELQKKHGFGFIFVNHTDFNREFKPDRKTDTVFCFDVIDHVMNPLFLMDEIYKKCLKKNGVCYLSTPLHNKWGYFFNESEHFAEYRLDKLKILVEYAGFKIEKVKVFKTIPFWKEVWRVKSLQSVIRALTHETVIMKLRK